MSRFRFLLTSFAGLFILVLGLNGRAGAWLAANGFKIIEDGPFLTIYHGPGNEGVVGICAYQFRVSPAAPAFYWYMRGPLSRAEFTLEKPTGTIRLQRPWWI